MKKIFILLLVFSLLLFLVSCNNNYQPKEQPVSYTEDIEVIITKIAKKQWFAGTAQREVSLTVYSKEYNITAKDTVRYVGMFGNFTLWEAEKGDTVKARMIVYYMQSTGEITKRFIDKIYS